MSLANDIKKIGHIALKKTRELDRLIKKLNNTTIGTISNEIENNTTAINELSQRVDALENKKGLCPQSLII